MDARLQRIMEEYDEMKIDLEGTFKFHCTMCGKCCREREDILLTPRDIYRMSKELGIVPEELLRRYCEAYIGADSRVPIVRLRPRGINRECPLLKERKCLVHKAKPTVCAMFPIGRCIRMEASEDPSEAFRNGRVEYIYTNPGCGDDAETHTVREWLQEFDISDEDAFFLKWHRTLYELGNMFRRAEEKTDGSHLGFARTAVLVAVYLNYDMGQEFLPQFEENAQKITVLMRMALAEEGEVSHG